MTDTEKGNVTSNLTADTSNKVAVNKSSKKLRSGRVNDGIEKKGTTISGGRPDQINLNPSQNFQEQSEHTAVTNLNMRAQPVHSGHAKLKRSESAVLHTSSHHTQREIQRIQFLLIRK